jgi:hypothetical protein
MRKKGNMPISYVIDKQNRLVVGTATGVLTADDILQVWRQFMSDPDFDANFSQLGDLSAVTRVDLTAAEVRMLAESNPFPRTTYNALVGQSLEVYGLARMFSTVRGLRGDDRATRVFRTREEALAWLLQKEQAA